MSVSPEVRQVRPAVPVGAEADATIDAAVDSMQMAQRLLTTSCSHLWQGLPVSRAAALVRRARGLLDHAEWALNHNSEDDQ